MSDISKLEIVSSGEGLLLRLGENTQNTYIEQCIPPVKYATYARSSLLMQDIANTVREGEKKLSLKEAFHEGVKDHISSYYDNCSEGRKGMEESIKEAMVKIINYYDIHSIYPTIPVYIIYIYIYIAGYRVE